VRGRDVDDARVVAAICVKNGSAASARRLLGDGTEPSAKP
jgi:hypothetical protein